jgi:4-carboxymuconolactone decarboxylase
MAEDYYGHLRERGDAGWDAVMQSPNGVAGAEPGTFRDLTRTILFGDVWQRPHLSRRERRLAALTVVSVSGYEAGAAHHIHGGLASGDLTIEDVDELAIHLAFYAGWPVGSRLHMLARQAEAALAAEGSDDAP